ncbi:MAG TPA: type II secretion system protein N, partial [Candidatus Babeliaceae bacterium]|nr:type II secretion system protein N [Candidatus Babeliaceae bacterium]
MMMRSPLWILNDIVGIILMAMLGFVLLYKPEPPIKKTLTPAHQAPAPKKDTSLIDIKRIYNNDLFNTYSPAVVPTSDLTPQEIPFPTPPLLAPVQQPTPANPQILPPLGVTLKGILFSNNEKDTLAVISDNKTKQESLYKVGDLVEDAEIIRIAKNQVIFIRTNGQQEVIFITLAEAQKDPHFAPP